MTDATPELRSGRGFRERWRLSLRWKIVGLTGVSMAALVISLAVGFAVQARAVMLTDLRARAKASAQSLAKNLPTT